MSRSTASTTTTTTSAAAASHVSRELDAAHASPAERDVLKRIEAQRDRLHARALAMHQARALKAAASDRIDADAPLAVRLLSFARLHPVAVAGVLGVALAAGPSKLIRLAGIILPIVMRMRK